MNETKPFIFIEPLSETLQKLKEIIAETASEEGIEIFTIEDILEANQLIPTIGQGLIVCSNAKKCAAILQANRKYITQSSSKVLLLTPKVIPRKTLEKFMKVGLTECIVEPVPPKTLLYKVKLLLRSISTRQEQQEMEMRSLKSDEASEVDNNAKQRVEKGIIADDSAGTSSERERKKDIEIDFLEEAKLAKKNKAEEIDSHWSGQFEKEKKERPSDTTKGESLYSENPIAGHYKGKLSQESEDIYEDNKPRKKNVTLDSDDLFEKEEKSESVEIDYDQIKAKLRELSPKGTTDKALTSDQPTDKISTHYKGKLAGLEIDEEEYDSLTTNTDFDLDFSTPANKSAPLIPEEEDEEEPSKKTELDLYSERDERKKKKDEYEEESEEREYGRKLDLKFDEEARKRQQETSESTHDPHEGKIDHIETMLKGHLDHRKNIDEDSEDYRHEQELIDLVTAKRGDRAGKEQEPEADDYEEERNTHLNLLDEGRSRKSSSSTESEAGSESEEASSDTSDLELDGEAEPTKPSHNEDSQGGRHPTLDLKLEDDRSRKQRPSAPEEADYMRTKSGAQNAASERAERSAVDAHAEKINTYYKSGEGIKHQDNDWSDKYKRTSSKEEEKKAKQELALQMLAKENLGEQTIDYRRLKEQFDAISFDSNGRLKMSDVIGTAGANGKKSGPRYYRDDIYAETEDEKTSDSSTEEDQQKNQIFYPQAGGLDFVIAYADRLAQADLKEADHFEHAASYLQEFYQGYCAFYMRRPEKSNFELVYETVNLPENFDFKAFQAANVETWSIMSLPYWFDHTFTAKDQFFFFPFTEGSQKIGYAVVKFCHALEEGKTTQVEVIVESLRGLYLQNFHRTGLEGDYAKQKVKSEETSSKGFINKLMFWKKAG